MQLRLSAFLSHRLVVNAAFLVLMRLVTYAAPFLALGHLLNVLGLELYGIVAFGIAIIQLATLVSDAGLTLAATQKASTLREKPKFLSRLMGGVLGVKIGLALALSIIIVCFALISERYAPYQLMLLLVPGPILLIALHPTWLFLGLEKSPVLALVTILGKAVFLGMLFLSVRSPETYFMVPVADAVGNLVIVVVSYWYLRRHGIHMRIPSWRDITFMFRLSFGFFMSRLAVASYQNTAVLVLGLFVSPAMVAIFSISDQIYRAMQQIFGPLAQAMYPYMAREKDLSLFYKILMGVVCVAIAASVSAMYLGPYILTFLGVVDPSEVMTVLRILLIALVFQVLSMFTGYPLYVILGRLEIANRSIIYGAGVFYVLLAGLILSGQVQAMTLAWVIVLTELSVLAIRLFYGLKIQHENRKDHIS